MMTINISYRCGHAWTKQYVKQISKRDQDAYKKWAKEKDCPKCEDNTAKGSWPLTM